MTVPRFLPTWFGGEADRVDGPGVRLGEPYICAVCSHGLVLHERDDEGLQAACCVDGCQCGHDALPKRPEPVDEPLPEDLERVLRDPNIAVPQDWSVHRLVRAHLLANPEGQVTRDFYLNLWALIEHEVPEP